MSTQCEAYTFSVSVVTCNTCLLKLRVCLDFEYRLRCTSSQVFNDSLGHSDLSLKLHLHVTRRASFGSPLLVNVYLLNAVKDVILKVFKNMRCITKQDSRISFAAYGKNALLVGSRYDIKSSNFTRVTWLLRENLKVYLFQIISFRFEYIKCEPLNAITIHL